MTRPPALSIDSASGSISQPLQAIQTQSAEQQKHGMIVQMTMHAALRPLVAHVPASSASISGGLFEQDASSPLLSVSAFIVIGLFQCCHLHMSCVRCSRWSCWATF